MASPATYFVQVRGNYLTAGDEAPPIFPRILAGENQKPFASAVKRCRETGGKPDSRQLPKRQRTAGTRELDRRSEATLTARVLVNRVGSITSARDCSEPDNFGKLGERPTHPELLDWLACASLKAAGR